METFPQQTDNHNNHDDQWCVMSTRSQFPLCIACLVEHLDEQSLTVVQRQFNLSLLASVLAECDELPQLLREHPLVCQHIIDILTDHYIDTSSMIMSVQICVDLMDTLQSEDLYEYLLNKFYNQVQNGTNTVAYVVATLGRLSVISSAYVLTLILMHENLLIYLLEAYASKSVCQDDASECSLPFLLIHLFDADILPVAPPQVLPLVEQCLVIWMTTAQSVDLQVNTLALLKRVLSADCCLWDDRDRWMALLLGFKRMFVSKKEILVTAATQCLIMIASNPKHSRVLQLVLEGDLSEFLFESLHTLNVAQLEAVFKCLYLFTEHDLFFKKCHAVYGLESVLRSLDIALDSQNISVLMKGFCLLSSMLQRQPSTIPLFVNKSSLELMLLVLTKGAHCHAIQVILPTLTATTVLLKDPKMQGQQPMEFVETIVEAAVTKVGSVVWRGEAASILSSLQITEDQLLNTLLMLLTAVIMSTDNKATVLSTHVLEECNNIISYFSDYFTVCKSATLLSLFHFLNTLYTSQETNLQDLSRTAMSSGLVVQVLMKQSNFRTDLELLTSACSFVCHVFHVLVMEDVPQCQSLPDYLRSGLRHLSFRDSIQETVDDISEEDAAATLCMIFYFSCLNDSEIFSASCILYALAEFQEKQVLKCTSHRPLVSRFLLFLLAWTSAVLDRQSNCINIEGVEEAVTQHVSELPVELWATPSPEVFLWLFHTPRRANGPGASLLEHWLLHTKGSVPAADSESSQPHVICTLFLSQHFRAVLMNLMTSESEEISVLARKLSVRLITMEVGEDDQQNAQLIGCVHDEVMSLFQALFLSSLQPSRHTVNNFLQVATALFQHPKHNPVETDHNQQIKFVYHVVQYISAVDSKDCEILYNGMACLHSLSETTDEEQDRTVVPILVQNASFIQQLETCLHDGEQQLSSMALSLAAWISSSCPDCSIQKPISMSAEFILKTITNCACEHAEAALKVVYLSLVSSGTGMLSFHRSCSFLQAGPLFTTQELRLLFCCVQQYICSENKEIQFSAVQCLLKLIEHSLEIDSALGEHFLHHPWNPHLLHVVLSQSVSSGLGLHVTHLIKQIWSQEDGGVHAETAKLVLESILVTEISKENQDTIYAIFQKAKVLCQDKDLVERATSRLASLEDSLSFSQNTPTSC